MYKPLDGRPSECVRLEGVERIPPRARRFVTLAVMSNLKFHNQSLPCSPPYPPGWRKKAPHGMDLSTRQGRREQGQRIQQAVERAGLSIEELAGRVGCSRALIYQYLSGSTLAQPDRLQQIANQCGVPLTFFYSDTPDSEPATAQIPLYWLSRLPASTPQTTESSMIAASETSPAGVSAPTPPAPQEVTARLSDSLRALQELAQAQEGPPDYRALASTCERILSLAAQVG